MFNIAYSNKLPPAKIEFKMRILTIYTVSDYYPFDIIETIEARGTEEPLVMWSAAVEFIDKIQAELCQLEKRILWLKENQQVGHGRRVKLFKLKKRYKLMIDKYPEKVI